MIRRLVARLRRQKPKTLTDWLEWQERDFRERLRKGGPR